MDNEALATLIEKYLNGTCTPTEAQRLMEWYDMPENTPDFTTTLDGQAKLTLGEEMLHQIKQHVAPSTKEPRIFTTKKSTWFGIAAAIIVLILAVPLYNHLHHKSIALHTAFGEVKSIVLPDDSEVMLNGNSSITYAQGNEREVWLDGEAFFHVTQKADGSRFLVHLADTLTIEVVGTEFNVQNRPSGVHIALKSGKIILINGNKRMAMEPNDVIEVNAYATAGFEKSARGDMGNQLAWQHGRRILENTTLAELLDQLAETHGIQTHVHEDSLLERKASGSIPIGTDSEILLNHIGTLYGLVVAETNTERQYVLMASQ